MLQCLSLAIFVSILITLLVGGGGEGCKRESSRGYLNLRWDISEDIFPRGDLKLKGMDWNL